MHACFRRRNLLSSHVASIVLICMVAGCDSGEYNRRFSETAGQSEVGPGTRGGTGGGSGEKLTFDEASALSATADVKICLPKIFDSGSTTLTIGGTGASRAQPPFYKLPGFQYARESFREGEKGRMLPVYCYVAFQPTSAESSQKIRDQLKAGLEPHFSTLSSKDENVVGPNGEKISWRRFSGSGNQSFNATAKGGVRASLPGRFLLYSIATPDHEVIVAWRAPNSVDDKEKFFRAAEEAMSTLQGSVFSK